MMIIAGADKKRHEETLDMLSFLYLQLKQHDFEYSVIHIPRTNSPDDKEFVFMVEFSEDTDHVNVQISVTEDTFTPDDIFTFMTRAAALMRQTLKLYSSSGTIH